jgi:hypothetical protein
LQKYPRVAREESPLKRKNKKVVLVAFPVIAICAFLLRPIHLLFSQDAETITVIRHHGELFVFIQEQTNGWSGNEMQNLWQQFFAWAPVEKWDRKLILWHTRDGKISKRIHRKFDAGGPFIYRGDLLYSTAKSLQDVWTTWKWNGNDIAKLPKIESDKIHQDAFDYHDLEGFNDPDFAPRDDWLEINHTTLIETNPPRAGQKKTFIKAGKRTYIITMKQESNRNKTFWRSFELSEVGSSKPSVLLYKFVFRSKYVSTQRYQEIMTEG